MTSLKTGFAILAVLLLSQGISAPAQGDEKSAGTFKAKCSVCHGPGGKGDSPAGKSLGAADLTKVAPAKSDADLKFAIEKGKNKMPAYGKSLKPGEIDGLIVYIRSLK
jgi:cytochrome c6